MNLLRRLFRGRRRSPRAERPLSARLDNPYRPIYGTPRRFEQLTGPQRPAQTPDPGARSPAPGPGERR